MDKIRYFKGISYGLWKIEENKVFFSGNINKFLPHGYTIDVVERRQEIPKEEAVKLFPNLFKLNRRDRRESVEENWQQA